MSLPRYLTPTIGRAQALSEIRALLAQSRLVTIVGAGGIGKTRIAVDVARATTDIPVAFVDLEPIRDPELVISKIAAAAGVELRGNADPETALVKLLAQNPTLLVLDNCEHVLRRARAISQVLISSCPGVRILATSREALGLDAESIYRLSELGSEDSIELFIERANAGSEDRAAVGEICRKLDGIPLAIELAAARLAGRTPKALLARLKERFRLLGQKSDHTPRVHHRTLRALIDWSFDLLTEQEKAAFIRLSVFHGEFSREAVEHVVGDEVDIDAFVRRSLVVASVDASDRFRMLESVREYALLKLGTGQAETNRAHAHFYADLAASAAHTFGTIAEDEWLGRLGPDIDNFRAALTWMQRNDPSLAAATLGNLKEFWFHSNLSSEGLSRSQVMVATLRLDDDRALGPLLAVASLAWRTGENRTSYDAAARALEIAERIDDAKSIALARYSIGWALFKIGDMSRALAELRLAVDQLRAIDEPLRALLAQIDYAIALKRSDPAQGRALLERCLPEARESGWPRAAIRAETGLAEYAFRDGDASRAIELGSEALATARAGSSYYAVTVALVNLTAYLSIAGRHDEARTIGAEAIRLGRIYGFRIAVEWTLQSLAIGIAERDDPRTAATILGHVDAYVEEVGQEREPTEETVRRKLFELVNDALGESILEAVSRQGRALSMDEACSLVL